MILAIKLLRHGLVTKAWKPFYATVGGKRCISEAMISHHTTFLNHLLLFFALDWRIGRDAVSSYNRIKINPTGGFTHIIWYMLIYGNFTYIYFVHIPLFTTPYLFEVEQLETQVSTLAAVFIHGIIFLVYQWAISIVKISVWRWHRYL